MKNVVIDITNAVEADIPAMVALLNTLFSIEQDFQPNDVRQAQGLRMILANPQQAVIKVAHNQAGAVIGMVSAQLVISTAQGALSAWVEDMVIDEAYRQQGIGRQLLASVLDWAKQQGATRAQLLVDIDNLPAVGYYHHLGWDTSRLNMRRILL